MSHRLWLALLLTASLVGCQSQPSPEVPSAAVPTETLTLVVGTAPGTDDGRIQVYRFDAEAGTLALTTEIGGQRDPSFVATSADGRFVYAVNEAAGLVRAFAYEDGQLTFLNEQPAGGGAPCYLALSPDGQYVVVANYVGGNVALLPIEADGRLAPPTSVIQHEGSGPNAERQEAPHAHYIAPDPDGQYLLAADLGIDQVKVYEALADGPTLREVGVIQAQPGDGPRHLAFGADGRWLYVLNELVGTVTVYRYAPPVGMEAVQTVSLLPEGFAGANKSADLHVHPSGRFLYASNRGDYDSIAAFAVDEATGQLAPLGHTTDGITWPRNFVIDPSGRWLLVANRHADAITVYQLDPTTGALTFTGTSASVPAPTCLRFAPLA
ncbi:MAG: lactonase family protein [Bacteroidota bacterium]